LDPPGVALAADGLGQLLLELALAVALRQLRGMLAGILRHGLNDNLEHQRRRRARLRALLRLKTRRADRIEGPGTLLEPAALGHGHAVAELGALKGRARYRPLAEAIARQQGEPKQNPRQRPPRALGACRRAFGVRTKGRAHGASS